MNYGSRTLDFAVKSAPETMGVLETSLRGLSGTEVRRRLTQYGKNELPERRVAWRTLLLRQFRGPYIVLLVAAAVLAIFARELVDAATIVVILVLSGGLGFVQEYRSERTTAKLRALVPHLTSVRRDGREQSVRREDLVPGDMVLVTDGDSVPADLRITVAQGLLVDESVLTGESVPAAKSADPVPSPSAPGRDPAGKGRPEPQDGARAQSLLFQGTTVLGGRGEGVVVTTGRHTIFGEVAKTAVGALRQSAFEENLRRFSRFVLTLVSALLVLVFGAHLLVRGAMVDIPELTLFVIALAVGIAPEALPVVMTVTLAQGARALAKKRVVVRRLSAVQDLGDIDYLCVDKTGTLTENHLTFRAAEGFDHGRVRLYALLAGSPAARKRSATGSSFEIAMWREASVAEHEAHDEYERVWETPFDPERKRNAVVVSRAKERLLIVRGAPEVVLERAGFERAEDGMRALDEGARARWMTLVREAGERGERTIALAGKEVGEKAAYTEDDETGLVFEGLLFFEDPIKKTSPEAVALARELGVRVKIFTGDAPEVARSVALRLGIISESERVVVAPELLRVTGAELRTLAEETHVFARLLPQDKLRLLKALQERHIVGFLGEGVNDAPALAVANVAIVVQGASDVAREVSDVVLLDRDLHVIVSGVKIGRRIFTNVTKYLLFTMSGNFGNLFTIAVISVIFGFLPLLPAQVLLANLLTDLPTIAIATDRVGRAELRTPRRFHLRSLAAAMFVFGAVSSLFDFIFFGVFRGADLPLLRTLWFLFTVGTELALLFSLRTRSLAFRAEAPSRGLLLATGAALLAVVAIFTTPLASAFHFLNPGFWNLLGMAGLIAAAFIVTELTKRAYYRFFGENGNVATFASHKS